MHRYATSGEDSKMTVTDMRCDRCGIFLVGPAGPDAVPGRSARRFLYHPGDFHLRDDSGLFCDRCADGMREILGEHRKAHCATCGVPVERERSLYFYVGGDDKPWQLCAPHAAELLNTLRTVDPKLDPASFTLSGDWGMREEGD
jgi:ribosomal protein L37E